MNLLVQTLNLCLFRSYLSWTDSRSYSLITRRMEMNVWIVPAVDANNDLSISYIIEAQGLHIAKLTTFSNCCDGLNLKTEV